MVEKSNISPQGATHRYEHGGEMDWYCENERGLYRWYQGSWCASRYKSTSELMKECPLGRLTLLGVEQAEPVEDHLLFLARNLHAWPVTLPSNCLPGHDIFEEGFVFDGDIVWRADAAGLHRITFQAWADRRAELQNKPSWSDAPESAEWLIQHPSGIWVFGYGDAEECTSDAVWLSIGPCGKTGEVIGCWRDTLEQRPDMHKTTPEIDTSAGRVQGDGKSMRVDSMDDEAISRRMAQFEAGNKENASMRNAWYEHGELPPVGAKVMHGPITDKPGWFEVEVIAHAERHGYRVAVFEHPGAVPYSSAECFRPIRTDHQVLVDLARSNRADAGLDERDLADAILAAGFKRDGGSV